jgi:tetratricopeptide (TPR) repeat protein
MAEPAQDARRLAGHKVAFTGKLASLTLGEARELVCACGAEWMHTVTAQTTLLVVGQDGLPLRVDGRLTRNLQTARRLQRSCAIAIVNEADWLAGLAPLGSVSGLSTAQLAEVLQVPGQQIRAWIRQRLLQPSASVLGVHFFDFRQVSWAKTLCRLARAGVSTERIRRSLQQLLQWLPDVEQPLAQLAVLESGGRLLVRLEGGQLAEPTGQGVFDFTEEQAATTLNAGVQERTAAASFQKGCELEEAGRLEEAAQAYQLALVFGGPNATTAFNLANVLYVLGRTDQALESYQQAVAANPRFVDAWLNLGTVLTECGKFADALKAYHKVLALDPANVDVQYNLADTLDQLARPQEAEPHWRTYVRLDPNSAWGRYARRRLNEPEA